MPVLAVLGILLAIGLLMGLVNKYGPEYIDAKWLKLTNIVAIVFTVLWLLSLIFDIGSLNRIRVGG